MIDRDDYTQLHAAGYGLMMLDQFDRGKSDEIRQDELSLGWDCHLLLQLIQHRGSRSVVVDSMGYPAYYSLFLANHVTHGTLTVFEPQPSLFQLMCGTFALNSFSQVRCEPSQLGNPDESGRYCVYAEASPVRLEINKKAVMFSPEPVKAQQRVSPVIALDAYADTHQLKALDLWLLGGLSGGSVLSALKGGERQIQTHQPALFWELPWEPNEIYAIEAWLHERGYVVYGVKTPDGQYRFVALYAGSHLYQDVAWRIALENHLYTVDRNDQSH
jgi:hypothetical protein